MLALTLSGVLLRSEDRGRQWQSQMGAFASQGAGVEAALNLKVPASD